MKLAKKYKIKHKRKLRKKVVKAIRKLSKKVTLRRKVQKRRKVALKPFYLRSWASLPDMQKAERNQALEILRHMRMGETLKKASKEVGLSIRAAKSHIGNTLYKKRGKWLAKLQDSIQRCMVIYDKDKGKISITVKNSEDATSIGLYLALVNIALEEGKGRVFRKLNTRSIRDVSGKRYRLETNLNRLYELQDEREDEGIFEIYSDE